MGLAIATEKIVAKMLRRTTFMVEICRVYEMDRKVRLKSFEEAFRYLLKG